MQRHSIILRISAFVAAFASLFITQGGATVNSALPAADRYCNEQYKYCVDIPSSGKVEPHEGDSPNHGIAMKMPESGEVWTYAHWDAALLESPQRVLLRRLEIILADHPMADVTITSAKIAGLPAYKVRFSYVKSRALVEEIVIGYRKPQNASMGPGIIYEVGLKCSQDRYPSDIKILESLANTFRQTGL